MANGLCLPNRVPPLNPHLANHVCYRNCYLAENGNQLYTLIVGLSTCSCGVCQCLANNSTNLEPIGHYLLVCWFIDRSMKHAFSDDDRQSHLFARRKVSTCLYRSTILCLFSTVFGSVRPLVDTFANQHM